MRKWVSVAVAAGLFMGGMGGAVAASWHGIPLQHTTGAELQKGQYVFEPKGTNHGGFHFQGDLVDIERTDGHNVYVQAKVEGYGWNRFNGVQLKTVALDRVVYDGAAQYTSEAWIRVCRDRGSLRPDNCSPQGHYKR